MIQRAHRLVPSHRQHPKTLHLPSGLEPRPTARKQTAEDETFQQQRSSGRVQHRAAKILAVLDLTEQKWDLARIATVYARLPECEILALMVVKIVECDAVLYTRYRTLEREHDCAHVEVE
jgi:hypothetical protein